MAEGFGPLSTGISLVGLMALYGVLAITSALLERCGPIRLSHFAEEAGGALRELYDAPSRFEAFRFLLSAAARLALAALALLSYAALRGYSAMGGLLSALSALGIVATAVTVAEVLNRTLTAGYAETALRRLTGLFRFLHLLAGPFAALLAPAMPSERSGEEMGDDEVSDEEIEAFIAVGRDEGILEDDDVELVRGIVDFGDKEVKSVMTPRTDMVCAPADSALSELAEIMVGSGHSRVPLYAGSLDHIVGVVHIRDLLAGIDHEPPPAPGELAQTAFFVPATKSISELLREFQARHQQVAFVVDEYGGTAGLVTMEDVIEEIVGEIADEHDTVGPEAEALPDGSWRLPGGTPVEDLAEYLAEEFASALADTPYETVGGLVMGEVGDVPEFGAVVEAFGLRFTVEKVEERRVTQVRVEPLPQKDENGS